MGRSDTHLAPKEVTTVKNPVKNWPFPQRKKKEAKKKEMGPVVLWKTLRVSHSPTGSAAAILSFKVLPMSPV